LIINYAEYDGRRGQDCLNSRMRSDVMSLAPEDDTSYPFSYSQIIGIFHAYVVNTARGGNLVPQAMEFLWGRLYRLDPTWHDGFIRKRIFHLEFLPASDPNEVGVLSPMK
ncbi:hypothetical protein C8R44DRAFT_633305, partial [Mycena epipterygia]